MTAPGVFYPPDADTAEERLAYYATSSRAPHAPWLERTPPEFTFDVKPNALTDRTAIGGQASAEGHP